MREAESERMIIRVAEQEEKEKEMNYFKQFDPFKKPLCAAAE